MAGFVGIRMSRGGGCNASIGKARDGRQAPQPNRHRPHVSTKRVLGRVLGKFVARPQFRGQVRRNSLIQLASRRGNDRPSLYAAEVLGFSLPAVVAVIHRGATIGKEATTASTRPER